MADGTHPWVYAQPWRKRCWGATYPGRVRGAGGTWPERYGKAGWADAGNGPTSDGSGDVIRQATPSSANQERTSWYSAGLLAVSESDRPRTKHDTSATASIAIMSSITASRSRYR